MHGPKIYATHYHSRLGLPDNGRTIKGLVVFNSFEPGLALGC